MGVSRMFRPYVVIFRDVYGNNHQQNYARLDNAKTRVEYEAKNGVSAIVRLKNRYKGKMVV